MIGELKCEKGSSVYIDTSSLVYDKNGNALYKVLVKLNEEDKINGKNIKSEYYVGYTDLTQVEKSDDDKRLGLVKAKTEMRESPVIPEREKNMGMLDKDTKIDAITLVDIGGKKWIQGVLLGENDEFYISKDAVRDVNLQIKHTKENTGLKYIVDISAYDEKYIDDYLNTLKELKDKNLLGGAMMEIAKNPNGSKYTVQCLQGSEELAEKYSEISKHYGSDIIKKMGDYNMFKKYVEETARMCPVGFYVYVNALDENQTSAIANAVAVTEKQLQEDVPEYKKAKKLPLTIDIETGDEKDKQKRTDELVELVKLLGKGTTNEKYWTVSGYKKTTGLNVIDNLYLLYTLPTRVAAQKEKSVLSSDITSIEEVKERTPGYTLVNFAACYINDSLGKNLYSNAVQDCFDPEFAVEKMRTNNFYSNSKNISYYNIAATDIMQCMGNVNQGLFSNMKLDVQPVDFSICSEKTLNEIISGTFKGHTGNYIQNMANAVEDAKMKNKTEHVLEESGVNNKNNYVKELEKDLD